jgi:hypothetical protein
MCLAALEVAPFLIKDEVIAIDEQVVGMALTRVH